MDQLERIPLRGVFELTIRRQGKVIERVREDNLIVNVARNSLARLIAGDGATKIVTQIGVGENGAGPSPDDTALTNPFTKALSGRTYPAAGAVQFTYVILEGEANGKIIREFGLISHDGTLFARKVRTALTKENDLALEGAWTIQF